MFTRFVASLPATVEAFVDRRLRFFAEAATVIALFALACAFARPQVEGWAVIATFQKAGFLGAIYNFHVGSPTRLIEQVPLGVATQIGAPGISVGIVYATLLSLKYLIARWAIAPVIAAPSAWVLATLAAVMLPWSAHWRGHNMSQEFAWCSCSWPSAR
jgi:hypothetical protein